jgi:NAD(P)-dependent dehydrogenase (short-subunit alcohol dehydrogenase family)
MTRLDSKVALVTGGNSGIGLATARRFRDEGAQVAIAGRNTQTLAKAEKSIVDVVAVQADVTNLNDIDRILATVAQQLGPIDVLFINAGIGAYAPLSNMSERGYDEIFDINTKGAYFTMQKAIPRLNDGASIILTGLAPITPAWRRPGTSAYGAAKAALRSLAQTAAAELADQQIRVNVVSPGPILTPIFERTGLPKRQLDETPRPDGRRRADETSRSSRGGCQRRGLPRLS